mmetsp:Transcript_16628/g.18615  ORF Transcript_16628/g.18615 Transcript_16628/m.18615 type:complete len:80 (-) Transcript_16628:430-669(-)
MEEERDTIMNDECSSIRPTVSVSLEQVTSWDKEEASNTDLFQPMQSNQGEHQCHVCCGRSTTLESQRKHHADTFLIFDD